jgi:hypothetical protein
MAADVGMVDCKDAKEGCSCKLVTPPQTQSEAGTYTTAGTKITAPGASGEYCVKGNELHIMALDPMSSGSDGQPRIVTDVVGKKR